MLFILKIIGYFFYLVNDSLTNSFMIHQVPRLNFYCLRFFCLFVNLNYLIDNFVFLVAKTINGSLLNYSINLSPEYSICFEYFDVIDLCFFFILSLLVAHYFFLRNIFWVYLLYIPFFIIALILTFFTLFFQLFFYCCFISFLSKQGFHEF